MTGSQQITILNIFSLDKSKWKGIITCEKWSQVYSTDKVESESVITDESSMDESESESVRKIINTNEEKYSIDETEHEEPLCIDNLVTNEPSYFNLF